MATNPKVEPAKELEIVSMIARGDKQKDIAAEMGVSVETVGNIKARNTKALTVISQKMLEFQAKKTARLLSKSHDLIEQRLDDEEKNAESQSKLWSQYENGDINLKEYVAGAKTFERLSLSELTAVSKEMFAQNKFEEGKGGGPEDTGNKADTEATLKSILEAMESGDTVKLQQIILIPKE